MVASGVFRFDDVRNKELIFLGTDGTASNNNLDMIEENEIGALLQKINDINPVSAKAEDVLKAATENGAKRFKKDRKGRGRIFGRFNFY